MKPLILLIAILTLSCNSTENQIQVFEDTLGIEETEALNVLVSDFETNLSNTYPDLSSQDAYLQYLTDFLSLKMTSYKKFNFQTEETRTLFKKSGLWNEVHRIDTTRAGYQVNVHGKYMHALERIKDSDSLVKRYYESRKKDGIVQDRLDAILNSEPNFDNYIHKRIVVLEFGY
ncbi:MAG: hypothetical protein Aureis2KO_08430 [Aureisphaera sp.]